MRGRYLGVIFIVIGIIALVGSLIFMFILAMVGQGIEAVRTASPDILAQAGTDAAGMQAFYQQMSQAMLIGWIWSISVVASSVISIYSGVRKFREKTKK